MKHGFDELIEDVLKKYDVGENGLSDEEARKRSLASGKNILKGRPPKTILAMVIEQLTDKMILMLIGAAILSFFLKEYVECVVIFVIVGINLVISIIQEKKAATAVEALKQMNAPHASVLRDGEKKIILARDLVVGDLVYLEDGMIVPADLRLMEDHRLMVDESSLTGESEPAMKDSELVLASETLINDQKNMVFSSSIVTYGTGMGIVVAIGMQTQVGSIARMLDENDDMETPLKKKLNAVGKVLSIVGIFVSILIFIIGFSYGREVIPLLMISISLAISVIPEGLPATATIVMALGVERMAKKRALLKKLPAVETLGSASVVCSDKTGTLTQNKMTVTQVLLYENCINGSIWEETPPQDFVHAAVLCNNASISDEHITGDPTEIALLSYVKKYGFDPSQLQNQYKKELEQPFDSIRKRMTTIHQMDHSVMCYTKGALEEVLPLCTHVFSGDKVSEMSYHDKDTILKRGANLSKEGLRLLAFAEKKLTALPQDDTEDVEHNLTFIGMVAMMDPPREEVRHAIETCHEAGIRVIMITGDHKLTATSIGKQLGICTSEQEAMTGEELHQISETELQNKISHISVFARVAPEDKLRIVNALKKNNEVVAMTGDGVNDAPALKVADIGIAMGITGTDVAKSAADMILLDDNFTTIELAIREGRRVYRNIQKVIQFLLTGNIAEVFTIFFAMLLNIDTPILAMHILFVNLVTDTLPALALGVDPESPDSMKKKPTKMGTLFEKNLIHNVIFYGIMISILSLSAYFVGHIRSYETAITMTFLVLSFSQIIHALNQHSDAVSIFSKQHPRNKYLYLAMMVSSLIMVPILLIPPFADFFSIVPLTWVEWQVVIILSIFPLLAGELVKMVKRWSERRIRRVN